jgi:hypothetical protein
MSVKTTLFSTIIFLLAAASSQSAVVLTIDITNPSAVIISSVANNSAITGNLVVNFKGGISFRNFFTANENITLSAPLAINGNWTSRGTTSSFNEMVTFAFNNENVVPGVDLSIYNASAADSDDQNLLDTAAPFTGSSIVNMSTFTNMPAIGTSGDVNLGFLGSQGGVIGQWNVIPEPSSLLLALVGISSFFRRRR